MRSALKDFMAMAIRADDRAELAARQPRGHLLHLIPHHETFSTTACSLHTVLLKVGVNGWRGRLLHLRVRDLHVAAGEDDAGRCAGLGSRRGAGGGVILLDCHAMSPVWIPCEPA